MKHADLKDTLFSSERARAVAEFQEKYNSEKQTRKIKELELSSLDADLRESKLRQTRNIFLIVSIGIIILAFGLWSRLRYISRTKSIIENSSETGRVNISQATYELLNDDPNFTFKSRGKIETKGKREIEMWFVEKAS